MRVLITLLLALCVASGLTGCAADVTGPTDVATVQSHFFPFDNGLVYVYSRFTNNHYDTISCRMIVGQTSAQKDTLLIEGTNTPLYYLRLTQDASGNPAAELESGDTTLLALDGVLEPTATWIADQAHGIQATVVDRYDDYYLRGRMEHFSDVLAIKYHTNGQPDNVYTLRFFARDHGLILERQLVGPNTEIASLQLLGIQYPTTGRKQADGPVSGVIRSYSEQPFWMLMDTIMYK